MSTERPCFFAKQTKDHRRRGCQNPARYRVIISEGFFIDLCEDHVEGYKGLGYKIVELREVVA